MPKDKKIEIEYDENAECERCGAKGAIDFVGEILCKNCVANDVFETINENNN